MVRGQTIGGIQPKTKRRFDNGKLHFKDPDDTAATADEFLNNLLDIYDKSKNN
jgi:hypothetical protein